MPKLFLGNFDFEHELADPSYRTPARLKKLNSQLTAHLIAFAEDGDFLLTEDKFPEEFLEAAAQIGLPHVDCVSAGNLNWRQLEPPTRLAPWGCSQSAMRLARKLGLELNCPPVEVTGKANDRALSHQLDSDEELATPGIKRVESCDELVAAIHNASELFEINVAGFEWVTKSRFGMASRSRIRGTGPELAESATKWLWKELDRHGCVFFEPWLNLFTELSTQWVIAEDGECIPCGWSEIANEKSGTPFAWHVWLKGQYRLEDSSWALGFLSQATREVAKTGYFGPLGIDSAIYRLPEQSPRFDPDRHERRWFQDFNARLTMGRVAIEIANQIVPGSAAANWLLLPTTRLCESLGIASPEDASALYQEGLDITGRLERLPQAYGGFQLPRDAQAILTSPLWFGESQSDRTGVLITCPNPGQLFWFFRNTREFVLSGRNMNWPGGPLL